MARLAGRYPVAGLDLPGFGRSGAPRSVLDSPTWPTVLAAMARRARHRAGDPRRQLLRMPGDRRARRCRQPGRAVGLVLNAPTIDPAHRTRSRMLLRVLADIPREPLRSSRRSWRATTCAPARGACSPRCAPHSPTRSRRSCRASRCPRSSSAARVTRWSRWRGRREVARLVGHRRARRRRRHAAVRRLRGPRASLRRTGDLRGASSQLRRARRARGVPR